MSTPEESNVALDSRSLAESLELKLVEVCEGRLGKLVWFRTDWQRGGAAIWKQGKSLTHDSLKARCGRLLAMIGMALENRPGAIKLLQNYDLDQRMRHRHSTQRNLVLAGIDALLR